MAFTLNPRPRLVRRKLPADTLPPGEDDLVCSAHREWGERFQRLYEPLPPLTPAQRR